MFNFFTKNEESYDTIQSFRSYESIDSIDSIDSIQNSFHKNDDIQEIKVNNKNLFTKEDDDDELESKDKKNKKLVSFVDDNIESNLVSPNLSHLNVPTNTPTNNNVKPDKILDGNLKKNNLPFQIFQQQNKFYHNNLRNLKQNPSSKSSKFINFKNLFNSFNYRKYYDKFRNFIGNNYLKIGFGIYFSSTLYNYCFLTYNEGIKTFKNATGKKNDYGRIIIDVFEACNNNKTNRLGLSLIYPFYLIFNHLSEIISVQITNNIMQNLPH